MDRHKYTDKSLVLTNDPKKTLESKVQNLQNKGIISYTRVGHALGNSIVLPNYLRY